MPKFPTQAKRDEYRRELEAPPTRVDRPNPIACTRCGQPRLTRRPDEPCCRIRWGFFLQRLGRRRNV